MENPQSNRNVRLVFLCLVGVTAALYGAVLGYDFITFDDPDYVTENPLVQSGLTWRGVGWAFTTGHASNWHPLTWLTHMLDCQLFGLSPAGHHFTNLLLHAANTLLLFSVLRRMTGAVWRSAMVAALFAWHPLHVESVAWVAERKDVLCACFWMLGLHAYTSYAKRPAWRAYALTLLCFAAGLLSKPMVVTFPCVLLLLDFWPLRRIRMGNAAGSPPENPNPLRPWPWLLAEKVPFLVLSAAASWATFHVQNKYGAVASLEIFPFPLRVENALVAYVTYLRKTISPHDLAVFYPHLPWFSWWWVGGAILLLAVVTSVVVWRHRQQPFLLVGWLWFLGTLFPVIGLVQVGSQGLADRYTYLPLIGIFISVVWGFGEIHVRWPRSRSWLLGLAGIALSVCIVLTQVRLRTWEDSITLFENSLRITPDNVIARDNLGIAFDLSGRTEEAIEQFKHATVIAPKSPDPWNNLGWIYAREGKSEAAYNCYATALRLKPDHRQAHNNLGLLLALQERWAEAALHYQEVLRLAPNRPSIYYQLGAVWVRMNKLDEAMELFARALQLQPDYPEVESQIGSVLQRRGEFEAARQRYAKAVQLNPDFAHARVKLGLLLAQRMQFEEAKLHFNKAIQLEPTNDAAFYNLAGVLQAQGQLKQAAAYFSVVVGLKPDDADARHRLGDVLAQAGRFESAIPQYREALRLKPDFVRALGGLASVLATNPKPELRNGAEAVQLAERANQMTGSTNLFLLTILDQAYAEAGRFEAAIKIAQQVQQLALAGQQPALAEGASRRLEAYRAGKPDRR